MADQSALSHGHSEQEILNAVAVPPRHAQVDARSPIPVRARLVWERDGIEVVEALAIGWTRTLAWVQLDDPRSRFVARWLPAGDVERLPRPALCRDPRTGAVDIAASGTPDGRLNLMDKTPLDLHVDVEDLRRVFGMLTGYVLVPEASSGYTQEFGDLDLAARVRTLAAGRSLWHMLADHAARAGVCDGQASAVLEDARAVATSDFALLPAALDLARRLDEAWSSSTTVVSTQLVADVAADPTRALGALAFFLRAGRVVLHATATHRGIGVEGLLASFGLEIAQA